MHMSTIVGGLALSASTAFAAHAVVRNKCGFPVYVTSVQTSQDPIQKILPRGIFSEDQKPVVNRTGVAVKIAKAEADLAKVAPVLVMAYSWSEQSGLYYSLSTQDGFNFKGEKIRIHNPEGKPLEEIVWVGEPKPARTAAYLGGEADLTLELCDDFAKRF